MTASFPRNWDYFSAPAVGAQAVITLPAIPVVSHVLTAVNAQLYNATAAAVQGPNVQVVTGTATYNLGFILSEGGVLSTSALDWTGMITLGAGIAMTVEFDVGIAGYLELLEIQGYDF